MCPVTKLFLFEPTTIQGKIVSVRNLVRLRPLNNPQEQFRGSKLGLKLS